MAYRVGGYEIQGWVEWSNDGGLCRAHDLALDRVVALKYVATKSGPAAKRLRSEAHTLAGLAHPHIVSVFDLLENDAGLWLVEEWVDGADLRRIIVQTGRLSAKQGIAVVHGALQGLAYAHERGVVHADITLRNILVDVGGTSKLVDFGLARPAATSSGPTRDVSQWPSETILGTPGLVSPQVVAGWPATPADDVYSAGVVLASLLLGRSLFAGATVQAVLANQYWEPPNLTGITSGVQGVLARALAANPAQRYPEAGSLLSALDEAAERDHGPAWLAEAGLAALVAGAGAGAGTAALHATLTASTTSSTTPSITALGPGTATATPGPVTTGGPAATAVVAHPKPAAARTFRRGSGRLSRTPLAIAMVAVVVVVAGATVVVAASRNHQQPPPPTSVVNAARPSATTTTPATRASPTAAPPTPSGPVVWASLRQLYDNANSVNDLSCPADDFCVAAVSSGTLRTFTERTSIGTVTIRTVAADAVSCASPTFCMAGTEDGDVTRWNGTSWSKPELFARSSYNVTGVSCPAADFCMIAGPAAISTWDGNRWSPVRLPGDQKSLANYGLSCVSSHFCAITTTSDQDPPFVYTWNGASWSTGTRLTVTSAGQPHVSCATESFCMLVTNDRYLTWDGSAWSAPKPISPAKNKYVADVSCLEASFCQLVTSGDTYNVHGINQVREGSSRASTWNGSSWSSLKPVNAQLSAPIAISCVSSTFCAVGEVIAG